MISKAETNAIKAISIISVILCHFYGWIYKSTDIFSVIAGSLAQCGVFLFLFLSGYGICKSFRQNGLDGYWKKRLVKIYIPFIIVVMPQFILEVWKYRSNIGDMYIASTVLSAIGLYPNNLLDGTLWFVCFILFEYFIFYSLCKLKFGVKYICLLGGILSYIFLKWQFVWVRDCDIYGIAFWIGILFAEYDQSIRLRKSFVAMLCAIVYAITLFTPPTYAILYAINGLSLSCLIILLVHLAVLQNLKTPKCVLEKLGNLSYELYLTEAIFFWNKILYDVAGYNYIGLMLHLCVILLLAAIIQKLSAIASRLVLKNWQ